MPAYPVGDSRANAFTSTDPRKGIYITNSVYRCLFFIVFIVFVSDWPKWANQGIYTILGVRLMWTAPVVTEIAVGLEINCYACADL